MSENAENSAARWGLVWTNRKQLVVHTGESWFNPGGHGVSRHSLISSVLEEFGMKGVLWKKAFRRPISLEVHGEGGDFEAKAS